MKWDGDGGLPGIEETIYKGPEEERSVVSSEQDSGWEREVGEEDREPGRGRVMQRPVTMTRVFFWVPREILGWCPFSEPAPQPLLLLESHTVAMGLLPRLSFLGSLYFLSLRGMHVNLPFNSSLRFWADSLLHLEVGASRGSQNPTLAVDRGSRKASSLETAANWEGSGTGEGRSGYEG